MCVLQSQSFQYPSLPEVRGKGQNNDEHDDWSSSNQRWSRCDGDAADRDAENGVQPTRELETLRSTCRVAILYALGYLYEHRDEADHKQLMLTLRSILFAVREGVF